MSQTNPYCDRLGIEIPRLEVTKSSAEANYNSLLIVALLERGAPITLAEAAKRFENAGVAPADRALSSLKRCKPGRPPICRDGDQYALDARRARILPPDPGPVRDCVVRASRHRRCAAEGVGCSSLAG